MKNIALVLTGIIVLALVIGTAIYCWPKEIGRYQLLQGEHTVIDKTRGTETEFDELAIFKIDTTTGKTWKLSTEIIDEESEIAEAESESSEEFERFDSWETIY